jgi:hypothetical protein
VTTLPRRQLRLSLYLNVEQDGALMLDLERWRAGRRSGRLRELARLGAEAEGLESSLAHALLYQPVASEGRAQRQLWSLSLRINATEEVWCARLLEATNPSDRLRRLATKGLEREAVPRSPQAVLTPQSAGTHNANEQVSAAMRAMMGTLMRRN